MYQAFMRILAQIIGRRVRFFCLCGWAGNNCLYTHDGGGRRLNLCPRCCSRLR